MKELSGASLHLALIHYPVVNKNGETIASAVTNLDIHDIARISRTYGIRSFHIVTPLKDQQVLVRRIISHWLTGGGADYNSDRRDALSLIRLQSSVADAVAEIREAGAGTPKLVATCARMRPESVGYTVMREFIAEGRPCLLCFGTAWGLPETFLKEADYVLDPIDGGTGYNHLSVRSAVSIILDRLVGQYR